MFGNFIYFIIGVLIFSTYQSPKETNFGTDLSLSIFVFTVLLFTFIVKISFKRLEKKIDESLSIEHYDALDSLTFRMLVLAIMFYTFDIYGLNISSFVESFYIFQKIPTTLAFSFLILFIFYFSIVWYYSYGCQERLYNEEAGRSDYVGSQISFSVPVLLPWLLISSLSDIIYLLPYEYPKKFIDSPGGQTVYFLFFLILVAFLAPVLISKFWGCKPLPAGDYRDRIESMCQKAHIKYANILYWPIMGGKMITAGVMGLIHKFRYILVTKALLEKLSPLELDSVVAHEIGHIKRKHLAIYLIFFLGYILFSFTLMDIVRYAFIYSDYLYELFVKSKEHSVSVISIVFALSLICIFLIYFRFIFGYFMRNFERQADLYVFTLMGNASFLISSLEKITRYSGRPPEKHNWHHFSVTERIDYLKKCEDDRSWIQKHEKKIKVSMSFYLVGMLIFACFSYYFHHNLFDDIKEQGIDLSYSEKLVEEAIIKSPNDPVLYSLLGNIANKLKKYEKAIVAYKKSIALKPDDASVLNNLAWLYATCEEKHLRNKEEALQYALKAASLEKAAFIYDTLAESYYVNGLYEKAVETSRQCLYMEPDNRSYYESQLEKFEEAFRNAERF